MLFNSYEFIFAFLPITLFIYIYLNKKKLTYLSKSFLVFCSLFFYSWWNIAYLPLILTSMVFNYAIGRSFQTENSHILISKKQLLIIGIGLNLAFLAYFKYLDFFISNINLAVGSNIELLNIVLPLAISFFTFQQISYIIDSYMGDAKEYDFLNYSLFVTFFPQLIAGPIVHHKEMMSQFSSPRNKLINYKNIVLGLFIFFIGLFKKVVIADTFSIWATNGYDIADKLYLFEAWITSLSYTFQLYFDFSGYADMAIGLALLFNIKLPVNFNSPYKAISIQDFWRRWHMTLSRFLKDYVYIPMGGNRLGENRTYINLLATFFLAGLWHGAGWTFVLWGVMHGLALVVHRLWTKLNIGTLPNFLAWFITFNFINISWVFFRAESFTDVMKVLRGMFGFEGILLPNFLYSFVSKYELAYIETGGFLSSIQGTVTVLIFIPFAFLVILGFKNSNVLMNSFKPNKYFSVLFAFITVTSIIKISGYSEFLYFRF